MRLGSNTRILLASSASLIAVMAAVCLPPATAHASSTTLRGNSTTGAAYSGNIQAQLLGSAIVSTSVGSGKCNQSTMFGSVRADGTGFTVSSAAFSKNDGPCGKITVTPQNLPWNDGSIVYAPVPGGPDGTVTIKNAKIKAYADLLGGVTCYYGGNLKAESFNPSNARRPFPDVPQLQLRVDGVTVNKLSGGSFLCPATATVTAVYQLSGQSSTGYNVPLHVTG